MFNIDNVIGFNKWLEDNKIKFKKEHAEFTPEEIEKIERDLEVEEFSEFRNEPVDSKGMTGIPDEDFTGVTGDR